jgi:hypothetical protein
MLITIIINESNNFKMPSIIIYNINIVNLTPYDKYEIYSNY